MKSCYDRLKAKLSEPPLNFVLVKALNNLWKVKVPSKVLFFDLRYIQNRIATKDQLFKRGLFVSNNDVICVMCMMEEENLSHLFRDCQVTKRI